MSKQPSKRYRAALQVADLKAKYDVNQAAEIIKKMPGAKFDETVEVSVNLGVDPRHADQQVRGVVNLPSGTGRDVRVAVFAKDAKAAEALAAGADVVGAEDLVDRIQGGFMDFDVVIASPDWASAVQGILKTIDRPIALIVSDANTSTSTATTTRTTAITSRTTGSASTASGRSYCIKN